MTLVQMINHQCTQAINEAVSRNSQATSARVVSLQFSFAVDGGNMGGAGGIFGAPDWYYIIRPSYVHRPHWRDTVDEVGSTYNSKKIGSWSNQNGQLEADADGDGNYTNGEYINAEDLDPSAQPTAAILAELDRAINMAWDIAQPNTHDSSARMVSCVAMNDREPEGLVPNPVIDVSKNAEDVEGVVERANLAAAGSQTVTTVFTNTGDEDLNSLTFADNTTSGNQVTWTSITLPNGSTVAVGGTGTPADVQTALSGVVLAAGDPDTDTPGGSVTVTGTVQVDAGVLHADRVTVTGTGVVSGQVVTDNDATEYFAPVPVCTGSIGDRVWEDTNKNGIQDAGEPGVGSVTVKLLDASDAVVATTTTDSNGNYLFSNVACGTYSVQFTAPSGYEGFTDPDQGSDDAVDSDANKTTGKTGQVTIDADNPNNLTLDAGLVLPEPVCTGSIGDLVWEDTNKNGIQDAGEPGVGSVTVKLLDASDAVVATTTTDSNGNYLFSNVACGTYSVQFTAPSGYEGFTDPDQGSDDTVDSDANKTTGKTGQVTIDANNPNNLTLDAGLVKEEVVEPVCLGSIGDRVWEDTNRNGIQDAGEPGVDGVTVTLLGSEDAVIATTTTSNGGKYLFEDVECGTYSVQFTAPDGYEGFADSNQGDDDTVDSDADKETGRTGWVTIDADDPNDLTLDAGLVKEEVVEPTCLGSIGDRVWEDTNRNGIQDAGEPGVGGVTVTLLGLEDAVIATTTTDGNGNYLFGEIECGTYSVQFTAPVGYEGFTEPEQGEDGDRDSDADKTTGKTGWVTIDSEMPNNLSLDAGLVKAEVVEPPAITPPAPTKPHTKVPHKLPSTGSEVSLAVGLTGLLLLAAGGGLLIARRKMQSN
ncbi:MAG: SdrD B-like domain-containing protein [Marmoricola sp.]